MSKSSELQAALEKAMALAIERHQADDRRSARALYEKVLASEPTHPVALHNLGLIALDDGDASGALELLEAAVKHRPREPVFRFNLGNALQQLERFDEAVNQYRKALKRAPAYRECWENLGVALQENGEDAAAAHAYRKALKLDSDSTVARLNLGKALRSQGELEAATAEYRAALARDPVHGDLAWHFASALLAGGDFESGLAWYERRWWAPEVVMKAEPAAVHVPQWDGGALEGRHLLVYGEQGIGDQIMFAACLPRVQAAAAAVTLCCDPRLVPLFQRSFPGISVRPMLDTPFSVAGEGADCDVACSIASLPFRLGLTAADLDGEPYLQPEPQSAAAWLSRLSGLGDGLKVGLSWRGGTERRARQFRSIELAALERLLPERPVHFIDIQYGDHSEEVAAFNAAASWPLHRFEGLDPVTDFEGFSNLVAALDLVISVDNSSVHLAGALGTPTLLLLPSYADWRWFNTGNRSPWYASVQTVRQPPGNPGWESVIDAGAAALAEAAPRAGHVRVSDVVPPPPSKAVVAHSRALLLNDTSNWYHWGCACTSIALTDGLRHRGFAVSTVPIAWLFRALPRPGSVADFDDNAFFEVFRQSNPVLCEALATHDLIVLNGEGTLHDLSPLAILLLYLAYLSKRRFGKRVHVVNHSVYPDTTGQQTDLANSLYRKVYAVLDRVVVREPNSRSILDALGIHAEEGFDCLPLYLQRHPPTPRPGKRVVLAGSARPSTELARALAGAARQLSGAGYSVDYIVGARAHLAGDDVALVRDLAGERAIRLAPVFSEAEWLAGIGGASLLISGRFHHTIAAAMLGTPFLVTMSNTPKIDGLLKRLGVPHQDAYFDAAQPAVIEEKLATALRDPGRLRLDEASREALLSLAEANFEGLTTGG